MNQGKILVLGGTGAMGKHLVDILSESGYLVYVTSRDNHPSYGNVIYLRGNAKDISFLYPLLKMEHYHSIFNFMTYTTDQFKNVVKALLAATDHYFFLSSSRVYADSIDAISENSPRLLDTTDDIEYLSTDNYALAKARQEDILRQSGLRNWTIIRPYLTYSEMRLQLGFFEQNTWLLRAMEGKTIVFSKDLADKYTTLTYGADVANVLFRLIGNKRALGEVLQITCGQSLKWADVLSIYTDELKKLTGKKVQVKMIETAPINVMPNEKWTYKYDRLFNRQFKSVKLEQILGKPYLFTSPEEGLRKCIREFMKKPNCKGYAWSIEAQLDRITGENTPPHIVSTKLQFLSYLAYRYLDLSTIKILINMKDLMRKIIGRIGKIFKEVKVQPIYKTIDKELTLQGKVVLITGGTGGIGYAVAETAINSGAKVILSGTNEQKLSEYCKKLGVNSKPLKMNIADVGGIVNSINEAIHLFPENKIDILINAAGTHGDWDFMAPNEVEFDKVMSINVKGMYFVSNAVARHMMDNNIKGHILNISSSSALRPAYTPYQISKWAVNGITRGLADYLLPHGIIVSGLAPGPTATDMIKKDGDDNLYYENQPSRRYMTAQEVANLAIFMVSQNGDMIVGDTFYITGGSGIISYHK